MLKKDKELKKYKELKNLQMKIKIAKVSKKIIRNMSIFISIVIVLVFAGFVYKINKKKNLQKIIEISEENNSWDTMIKKANELSNVNKWGIPRADVTEYILDRKQYAEKSKEYEKEVKKGQEALAQKEWNNAILLFNNAL